MISTRIFSFFFFLVAFGLFAYATPVEVSTSELSARKVASLESAFASDLAARCDTGSCTCTTPGCNEQAILTILTNLKLTIDASVALLDGIADPTGPVNDICVALQAAVQLLANVEVNLSTSGALIGDIVNIVVAIILSVATCVSKYGLVIVLLISVKLDLALSVFVTSLKGLIPGLVTYLSAALNVDVTLLQTVKFVLTLIACSLPCGC